MYLNVNPRKNSVIFFKSLIKIVNPKLKTKYTTMGKLVEKSKWDNGHLIFGPIQGHPIYSTVLLGLSRVASGSLCTFVFGSNNCCRNV